MNGLTELIDKIRDINSLTKVLNESVAHCNICNCFYDILNTRGIKDFLAHEWNEMILFKSSRPLITLFLVYKCNSLQYLSEMCFPAWNQITLFLVRANIWIWKYLRVSRCQKSLSKNNEKLFISFTKPKYREI